MKEHFSMAEAVCWFCGHSTLEDGQTRKAVGDVWYRACRNCHHAPAGEEAARRDLDVEGLKTMLAGGTHKALYWPQGKLDKLAASYGTIDLQLLKDPRALWNLKAKAYDCPGAMQTFERQKRIRKEYNATAAREKQKTFYLEVGAEQAKSLYAQRRETKLKQYHEGGGKEAAAERYRLGGGKEYARVYYQKKKAELARLRELCADKPLEQSPKEFIEQGAGI